MDAAVSRDPDGELIMGFMKRAAATIAQEVITQLREQAIDEPPEPAEPPGKTCPQCGAKESAFIEAAFGKRRPIRCGCCGHTVGVAVTP